MIRRAVLLGIVGLLLAWHGWLAFCFIQAIGKIAGALARLAIVAEKLTQ
jgi:hypothetical protein